MLGIICLKSVDVQCGTTIQIQNSSLLAEYNFSNICIRLSSQGVIVYDN